MCTLLQLGTYVHPSVSSTWRQLTNSDVAVTYNSSIQTARFRVLHRQLCSSMQRHALWQTFTNASSLLPNVCTAKCRIRKQRSPSCYIFLNFCRLILTEYTTFRWHRQPVGVPPMVISNVTPRSRNRHPEYCLTLEKCNPVPQTPQQILISCTFRGLIYATVMFIHTKPRKHKTVSFSFGRDKK